MIERRWCRISPHVIVLLPAAQPAEAADAGGAARVRAPAVQAPQCWLSFVTSYEYHIRDTTDEEMLALLRTLSYERIC